MNDDYMTKKRLKILNISSLFKIDCYSLSANGIVKYTDLSFFSSFIRTELFGLYSFTSVTSPSSVAM